MMWSFLKRLRAHRQPVKSASYRPWLEVLEERAVPAVVEPGFTDAPFVTNSALQFATGLAWSPDGASRLYVTLKSGSVRVIENGVLNANTFSTDSLYTSSECGLIGIAFDRNYTTNGY